MKISTFEAKGYYFSIEENGKEVAHGRLIVRESDRPQPAGHMEDIMVDPAYRGRGYGNQILEKIVEEARNQGCYKLTGTSRHSRDSVHRWYERHGLKERGLEFRLDFTQQS